MSCGCKKPKDFLEKEPKIIQLTDECSGCPIFPITIFDAVIGSDGRTLKEVLDTLINDSRFKTILNKISEIDNAYKTADDTLRLLLLNYITTLLSPITTSLSGAHSAITELYNRLSNISAPSAGISAITLNGTYLLFVSTDGTVKSVNLADLTNYSGGTGINISNTHEVSSATVINDIVYECSCDSYETLENMDKIYLKVNGVKGDINCDGLITIADANMAIALVRDGLGDYSDCVYYRLDINQDGVVNIADANTVLKLFIVQTLNNGEDVTVIYTDTNGNKRTKVATTDNDKADYITTFMEGSKIGFSEKFSDVNTDLAVTLYVGSSSLEKPLLETAPLPVDPQSVSLPILNIPKYHSALYKVTGINKSEPIAPKLGHLYIYGSRFFIYNGQDFIELVTSDALDTSLANTVKYI